MRLHILQTLTLVTFFCISCKEPPKSESVVVKAEKPVVKEVKNYSNRFNDIAGILSGTNEEFNKLNYLYDSLPWKENKSLIDSNWRKLEDNRLKLMVNWSKKELDAANENGHAVFYPFSGPDFLTSNAFFPKAKEVIMLGLEPVGALPDISTFSSEEAMDYCKDFKRSLTEIFEKSYFVTAYMLKDFQKQKVNGLLPVMCFFVKKTGHQIADVKYLVKYNNDSIVQVAYDTKEKPFGVKIIYLKDDTMKTIYYFKYDVSNKQFNDTNVFYKFINDHTKNSVTYIKSASYLLHANFMSNIRNLILTNSNYVMQDDTGIPYNYFADASKWNVKLYGEYVRPIKNFPYLKMQKGIMEAYAKDSSSVPKLPFHLGYHWQEKKDALIYASKK